MNIKIQNAWGEHDETMTLYRNNEKIAEVQINGANEPPDTLLDFLTEFSVQPSLLGISRPNLDKEPNFDNNGTLVWIIL